MKDVYSIRINSALLEEIDKIAEEQGKTRSLIIRDLLVDGIESRKDKTTMIELSRMMTELSRLCAGAIASSAISVATHEARHSGANGEDENAAYNAHLKDHIERSMKVADQLVRAFKNDLIGK